MTTISRVFVLFLIVIQKPDSSNAQLTNIESELAKFFRASNTWIDKNGKYFIDVIEENEQNISTNCAKHLVRMITNATQELWAAKSECLLIELLLIVFTYEKCSTQMVICPLVH